MNTSPPVERLFLLDGTALAYRSYYAFAVRSPLRNSRGENTGAVYGFASTLLRILEGEKPDHIAAVFDTPEPTFRHTRYPAYKATRERMPEELAAQLDLIREVVRAFSVPILEVPGVEADDVIGTLARAAEQQGVAVRMVTGDKDFMQLVSPLVLMYKPGRGGEEPEILDVEAVRRKFGVEPSRVIDVLGLMGDQSDNVPGVPGVGEMTAIPLIQEFGSMEGLYANLERVSRPAIREKLRTHRDLAFLSRELVTIRTDVPLPLDFHQLKAAPPDAPVLERLFERLEFRSLLTRKRREAPPPPVETREAETLPEVTMRNDTHLWRCITDGGELRRLAAELASAGVLSVDTETTGRDPLRAELAGIALARTEREAFYIPVAPVPRENPGEGLFHSHEEAGFADNRAGAIPGGEVLGCLKPLLENPAVRKVGQNIKYDMLMFLNHGIALEGVEFDTMVASYVLRSDGQHNLDALAREYLGYRTLSYAELVGKGKAERKITEVPLADAAQYACEDADITLRIRGAQERHLEKAGLLDLCRDLEFPLIPVLARMEFAGVALDAAYLEGLSKELEVRLTCLEREIHADAGEAFNINSTRQLSDILFGKLGLAPVRKTKTGFSTDVGVLESLRGRHPIVDRLLEYRHSVKLKSTYVDALPALIHPRTGRVHTSFNQTVASTGRLSSSDPNLQNIPIRTEIGRAIRKAFVAGSPGMRILSADYSQIELRIMAHVSGDEAMQEAFRRGEDVHASTARGIFGVEGEDVTRDMRRKAKEVNFGIMYGIGPFGLAGRLQISQTEAKEIIRRYFERFPGVEAYIERTREFARQEGYVATLLGRRRYIPEIRSRNAAIRGNAERQAINMPIQGTAADMIKRAMILVDGELRRRTMATRLLLQVHDELVLESPAAEAEEAAGLVRNAMQGALALDVPVVADVGMGRDWLEAH
ncbi:MAG: DNA polymerase I [Bacteroidota bacterium]